jgi:hypothetical protein
MQRDVALRGFRPATLLLAALALSIGWGIRGNFGHESGAMLPGALAAIVVCLLSGREDWRQRVMFFGMFGALGWAFGGSISYMQVITYTHSGHAPSQYYGFAGLFLIGFLWAGIGGASTALPGVLHRDKLTALCRPLCWVIAAFVIFYFAYERFIEGWAAGFTATWHRHESPLYWFDADWLQASMVLIAMAGYDLWNRKFYKVHWLPILAASGAGIGWALQRILEMTGLNGPAWALLVRRQGDLDYLMQAEGLSREAATQSLVINWPQVVLYVPQHIGWLVGLILGVVGYFVLFGKFRNGASLFVYLAGGWLVSFLIFPTLLGLRLTPPRSDDWAGILGVFIGAMLWCHRNNLRPVALGGWVCGIFGGLAFSGTACLKLLMVYPGNAQLVSDPATIEAWSHWQHSNWHSFLEQVYGFLNGVGLAVAIALVARLAAPLDDRPRDRRWTEIMAVIFTLFIVTFLNIYKNVEKYTGDYVGEGGNPLVADPLTAPWFESLVLPTPVWFGSIYLALALVGVAIMARHVRRPVGVLTMPALGKGQLFFLALLWVMVIANVERALHGFTSQRLLTEWVIAVNAVIATLLICLLPRKGTWFGLDPAAPLPAPPPEDLLGPLPEELARLGQLEEEEPGPRVPFREDALRWAGALLVTLVIAAAASFTFTSTVRAFYGDNYAGHASKMMRFGPEAEWRVNPLRRGGDHN